MQSNPDLKLSENPSRELRVASLTCILCDIPSLSDNSSARFLVPSTFLNVVWARRRVDVCALDTLATDEMGQCMRKYTTPSTATVTESLVNICRVKKVTPPLHSVYTSITRGWFQNRGVKKNRKWIVKLASCGGMSKEIVLRSTFTKLSVQGRTKKSPEMSKTRVSLC